VKCGLVKCRFGGCRFVGCGEKPTAVNQVTTVSACIQLFQSFEESLSG
jgi:hypothetical protein